MGFFINGKAVDDEHSNQSGALKNIRFLTKDDDLDKIIQQGISDLHKRKRRYAVSLRH